MGTSIARAEVRTEKPVPYMRQLCKHFGHKLESEYAESSGRIRFGYGSCELRAEGDVLRLVVGGGDDEALTRMERVIGSHLERFGARDGLDVVWVRQDPMPAPAGGDVGP